VREGQKVTAEQLQSFAREALADYKVPEKIVFLEELPKSPTGKVQRRALKEKLLETGALTNRQTSGG